MTTSVNVARGSDRRSRGQNPSVSCWWLIHTTTASALVATPRDGPHGRHPACRAPSGQPDLPCRFRDGRPVGDQGDEALVLGVEVLEHRIRDERSSVPSPRAEPSACSSTISAMRPSSWIARAREDAPSAGSHTDGVPTSQHGVHGGADVGGVSEHHLGRTVLRVAWPIVGFGTSWNGGLRCPSVESTEEHPWFRHQSARTMAAAWRRVAAPACVWRTRRGRRRSPIRCPAVMRSSHSSLPPRPGRGPDIPGR